jgi:uncharacterized protein DUF1420
MERLVRFAEAVAGPRAQLDTWLLRPAPRLIVTLLICVGLVHLGGMLARRIVGPSADATDRAGCFVAIVALVGALAHGLALAGFADVRLLALLAYSIAAAGVMGGSSVARALAGRVRAIAGAGRQGSPADRAAIVLAAALVVAYGIVALAPATDADSLDAHLGIAIDWLRRGGIGPRVDWYHARLAGLGEAINMVGLAAGTDALGACLQVAGLLILARAVAGFADTRRAALTGVLIVLSAPVMLFLASTQKFELLPAAATTVALTLVAGEPAGAARLAIAGSCLAFAVGCKYPFIFSAAVITTIALVLERRCGRVAMTAAMAVALFAAIAGPIYLRNLLFYGDPLSPFLERFRRSPDASLVAFGGQLRAAGGPLTWAHLATLPVTLAVPFRFGAISETLGIGIVSAIAARARDPKLRRILAAAAVVAALALALGQWSARFLIEPFVWCAAVATASGFWTRHRAARRLILAQGAVVACAAAALAVELGPGALSLRARAAVMTRFAYEYAAAEFVNDHAPPGTVLTTLKSHALLGREFIAADWMEDAGTGVDEVRAMAADRHVASVAFDGMLPPGLREFVDRCTRRVAESPRFARATRNPWNRVGGEQTVVASVDLSLPACGGPAPRQELRIPLSSSDAPSEIGRQGHQATAQKRER